ncbi:MAG: hypothetical protein A2V21_309950 [Deltaproteobacteria bacterium GWC2_55_46]|nr:MAG: hypothetical protein A3I81_10425 [Deltaproteobacteria bacterium RIFCSPLOWO2_02_FULL_55_12]OIJ74553.1 MAG: hypothetical protein A2V21_309950 [Deltaproteobacteria bacterium GWC2_55_46]HCY10721.1 hypothetical protein [Deltaproteobacteria bacterium]
MLPAFFSFSRLLENASYDSRGRGDIRPCTAAKRSGECQGQPKGQASVDSTVHFFTSGVSTGEAEVRRNRQTEPGKDGE